MKAMNYDKELFDSNKSMTGHNLFTSEETNGGVLFSRQKYNDTPLWVVKGSVRGGSTSNLKLFQSSPIEKDDFLGET